MPIIALLSDDTGAIGKAEGDPEEICVPQKSFRDRIRNTLLAKTWHNEGELSAYITSSLLDKIRPLEAAVVVQTNADLVTEVANYLNTQAAVNKPAQNATLIQYSSRNVRDIVRKLLWSKVRTRLYVVSKKMALRHQKAIVDQGLSALTNHLDPIDPRMTLAEVLSFLEIYRYDAPGSIRAISIDDKFLPSVPTYI
jgi:hypothetical protein